MTKSANHNMTSLPLIRNEASNWGNLVVTYFAYKLYGHHNCMEWKTSFKDVSTRVGSFTLHFIFCLGLSGGNCPLPPQMTPLPFILSE